MAVLLLVVIYIVFISLGLPDGVFGSAWPAIHTSLGVSVGLGGIVSLIATLLGIVSSLSTPVVVKRLGVGLVLLISTLLTAIGLLGFSQAHEFYWLIILAVPLGLGAGAIDSALNHYVATHYRAHHMNWLHAFWGLGATVGPIIFAASLIRSGDWHSGYLTLGLIQAGIVVLLLASLPLWAHVRERKHTENPEDADMHDVSFGLLLKDRSVLFSFLTFCLYVGIEVGIGLWLASYLVQIQGVSTETAAIWTGVYYGAITIGRIFTGFISFKVSGTHMIRAGILVSLVGALLLVMNISPVASIAGIILIGIGFAPIYPALIHLTPERFGKNKAAKVISLQMVGASVGASIIPPLIGFISGWTSLLAFAFIVPLVLIFLLLGTERVNYLITRK